MDTVKRLRTDNEGCGERMEDAACEIEQLCRALRRCLEEAEGWQADAMRYRWLKQNIDKWPDEYNAPHVRISEEYDYAQSSNLDSQIDEVMRPGPHHP